MKKKVLIIEDDSVLQKAMKEYLQNSEFEIIQAFDGKDGYEKVKSEQPDLVLLDLILPKEDGYHVLADIHNNFPQIPVVVITVISSNTSIAECVASGASGYLVKSDYSLEQLLGKIREFVK